MKLHVRCLLICGVLSAGPVSAQQALSSSAIPGPAGLQPCSADDQVATLEASLAAKLGGEYLGCFRSGATLSTAGDASAQAPVEYAFAIALKDREYKVADLDNLLSKVKQQWKDFDPSSEEFKESYTARLNALIKSSGTAASDVVSIKPMLVSIDRGKGDHYTVTSIRTYVSDVNGKRVTFSKIDAGAVALKGSQLIRLTILRVLSGPADVTQAQADIADWVRKTVAQN